MGAGSLSLARPLLSWMRADPAWSRLPLSLRARLHWHAHLGSLNARLAASADRTVTPPLAIQAPVLVLGPWRSGTTVMHELLAAATGLATPRTWQCMHATTFTTLPLAGRANSSAARPMDGLSVDAQSPQEDEFALLTLGVDSAYRAFWMPHRLGELMHTLDAAHWLADDAWLDPWEQFLRGVLRTSPQATQPLLLKSPNHVFRLQAIQRRWPGARVVWMLREGAAVAHSNLKMWRSMFQLHGLSAPVPGALEAFVAQALRACGQALDGLTAEPGCGRWALVAQDRLRAHAHAVVSQVHSRLQLPGSVDRAALQSAIDRTGAGREDRYDATVPDSLRSAVGEFDAAQRRALSRSFE